MTWKFNDSKPHDLNANGKNIAVEPAGMRKYYEFRRGITQLGYSPDEAAGKAGDMRMEKLPGHGADIYSLRLTQSHRVLLRINTNARIIEVLSIGGHY